MPTSAEKLSPPPPTTTRTISDAAAEDDTKKIVVVETATETTTIFDHELFKKYELYGWKPNPSLSNDANFMDLVMLVTRTSQTTQGSMACILVQPSTTSSQSSITTGEEGNTNTPTTNFDNDHIISVATNGPFYSPNDSDIHAEIAALGDVCKRGLGIPTQNCTAYITMPPCKRCMAALTVSGITRIVSRLVPPKAIIDVAHKHNIEIVALGKDFIKKQMERINVLIHGHPDGRKKKKKDGGVDDDRNDNEKKRRHPSNNNKQDYEGECSSSQRDKKAAKL